MVVLSTGLFSSLMLLSRPFSVGLSRALGRLWAFSLILVGGIRLKVSGIENLNRKKNYIFMSNHVSAADIIILYTALPFAVSYLAKKELFKIPLMGWAMRAVGHIPVNRTNPREALKSIDKAINVLKEGRLSTIVFPEGTRSETGELKSFKLGVFSLAIASGTEIVPVAIQGSRELLPKGAYHVNPGKIKVAIGSPISVSGYTKPEKAELAARTRKEILKLIAQESSHSSIDTE
jgi:1-acyl-sn-glycerol-3-phosphate acyltransferase